MMQLSLVVLVEETRPGDSQGLLDAAIKDVITYLSCQIKIGPRGVKQTKG